MMAEVKPEEMLTSQPDTQALLTMRRVMSMVLACFGAVTAFAVAVTRGSNLSVPDQILASLALALLAIGLLGSRRPSMLWFLVLAVLCMPVAALIAPMDSEPWVIMPNAVSITSLLLVLLVPRWLGLAVPPAAALLLAVIQSRDSSNVFSTTTVLLNGWYPPLQTMFSVSFLWWAWWRLRTESAAVDRRAIHDEALAERTLEAHQRTHVWRQAATRLHESALNVIAHVLSAPTVDRAALARQLQRYFTDYLDIPEPGSATTAPLTVEQVLSRGVRRGEHRAAVTVRTSTPDTPLPSETHDVTIAAIHELLTNAERHGRAQTIDVTAYPAEDSVVIDVTDDGRGLRTTPQPGIGLGTVLHARVTAVGGTFSLEAVPDEGTRARLTFPMTHRTLELEEGESRSRPFDKARLLVSAPVAGLISFGIVTFLMMVQKSLQPEGVVLTIGILGVCLCVFSLVVVVRRKRYGLAETLALAPVPIAIAGLLLAVPPACGDAALIGMVLNVTGLCTVLIALWGHPVAGGITLATWAVAALSVVRLYPSACTIVVGQALNNSLVVVPVLVLVSALGGRAFRKAQRRRLAHRADYVAMLARVSAAQDLDASVSGLLSEARSLLGSIADGSPLDRAARHQLEVVDGRLRAAIQVDPVTSGGMALAAHALVERASQQDHAVLVRSISSSSDTRPLPSNVVDKLVDLVPTDRTPGILRAMSDSEEDHLALTTTLDRVLECGLNPGECLVIDGVQIEIEHASTDAAMTDGTGPAMLTVVVSRRVQMVDGTGAADGKATDSD